MPDFLELAYSPPPPPPPAPPAASGFLKLAYEPVAGFLADRASFGKGWDEVQGDLEKSFPGVKPDALRTPYLTESSRQKYAGGEEQDWQYTAQAVPGFGTGLGMGQDLRYARAKERIAAGAGKEKDFDDVASYERMKQIQATESTPAALKRAAVKLPAVLGEVYAAGPALEGAAAIPRVGLGAKYLAMPALVPSLGAYEGATANVAEKGGGVLDPKNLGPAYGLAVLNGMVLGQLQGAGPVGRVPTVAGRVLAKGGLGVAEQAGADVFASAVDEALPDAYKTKTKYGLVGDLARAARGEPGAADAAGKHAAVQMFTFSAFAAAHGRPHAPVAEKFAAAADSLHDAGVPVEVAMPVILDAVEKAQQAPDREAAAEALKQLPDGPLKEYVTEAVLPTLVERRVKDIGPPPGVSERRAAMLERLKAAGAKVETADPTLSDLIRSAGLEGRTSKDKAASDYGRFLEYPGGEPLDMSLTWSPDKNAVTVGFEFSGKLGGTVEHRKQSPGAAAFGVVRDIIKIARAAKDKGLAIEFRAEDKRAGMYDAGLRKAGFERVGEPRPTGDEALGLKEYRYEPAKPEQPAERPPEAQPEPVTVTTSPQPVEPQDPSRSLRVERLTLGGAIVAAKQIGIKTEGVTLAKLKVMLRNHFGDDLPERYRNLIHGPPPIVIKRDLPKAGPDGLTESPGPGLGAPAGPPAAPLVENVNPGVARMQRRQADLERQGLVPRAATGVDEGVGLGRFNPQPTVPQPVKLSPKQHRARAWVAMEKAGQQAEALRERAGVSVGGQLGRAGDRPPDVPDRADPLAWKMRVLRDRLLSGRQLIAAAEKDPSPENVAAARGAVESIRRSAEANGERGRSLRDKAYPDWSAVEKRFAAEKPAPPPKQPHAAVLDALAGRKEGDRVSVAELRKALPGLSEHAQNEAILDAVFRAPGAREKFRLVESGFTGSEAENKIVRDAEPIRLPGAGRDSVFPWVELKAPAASEFGLRPLKAGEPVTVTGKGKLKPTRTPEEIAAGQAKKAANLIQNREGRSFVRQLQLDGGIDPGKFKAVFGQGEFDQVMEVARRKKGLNPFLNADGGRGTRHPEDVMQELADDRVLRSYEFQGGEGQQIAPDHGHFIELLHQNPRVGDLGGKAAATELAKADEARFQQEEDDYKQRLREEGHSEAEIAETLRLAGEEADRQINARWEAEQAAGRGQGPTADGPDGGDVVRETGGGAGRERGGRPEVPDPAAEAVDADSRAAAGGLDLSFDFGHNATDAAQRLLGEHVRANTERAAELPLPEAMGAASRGFTARLGKDLAAQVKDAAARLVHRVQDFGDRLAGGGMTRTARLSEAAANAGEEFAGKRIHAQELAPHLLDKVMPGDGSMADRLLFMSTFAEERLRHMRDLNLDEARKASNDGLAELKKGDRDKAAALFAKADAAGKAARAVISLVGKSFADPSIPYPLPDEAAYRRSLADPKYKERMDRHVKEVVPVMEEAFKKAEGMEETDPIHAPTQLPGRPVTLVGRRAGEETPTTVITGTGRGNLIGHRLRRLGAAYKATGAAENGYELDYGHVLERMLADRLPLAAKAEVYRTLEAEGLGVWRKPGEKYEPHGLPFRALPDVNPPRGTQRAAPGERNFLVHPDAYGELRQLFGTDEPLPRTPLAGALTVASIASGAEVLPHARNLLSMMTRPGMRFRDIYRGVRGELTKDPGFRAEILELARIGALKERGFENAQFKSKWNPLTYASKLLDVVDRAMRFTAAKAYDRMAERDGVEKSDRAKRQFVNQLGNYSKLTQNRLVAILRDTGFGPFATAASNFWMQSLRGNMLTHGVRTTSRSADLRLRAEMLLRMATIPAVVAALNYALNGRVDGDDETPIGALKIGKHKGKTVYLDLTSLTGITRGLRETGLLALAENKRPGAKARGATTGDAIDTALRDIVTGVTHPAMGPPAAFAETAMTGENTLGRPVAPKAAPGESQRLLDLYAAVWQANPFLESWLRPRVDQGLGLKPVGQEQPTEEKAAKLLGPYGPKFSGGPPGQPHRTETTPRPTPEQRLLRPTPNRSR